MSVCGQAYRRREVYRQVVHRTWEGPGLISVVYHLIDLDELSFCDADQVYVKFKSMMDEKRNLNQWPESG